MMGVMGEKLKKDTPLVGRGYYFESIGFRMIMASKGQAPR